MMSDAVPPTEISSVGRGQSSGDDHRPSGPFPRPFGRYTLLREIGRGGMGLVFEALDAQLGRHIAIKCIAEGNGDEETVERLNREGRAVARLRHPNIVAVHEVGEVNAVPYLTMDYVPGSTLAAKLAFELPRKRSDALRRNVEILATVAHAVGAAHAQGIIHRDLKPGNILLDAAETPFVTDFGLAKQLRLDGALDKTPSITVTGTILGTPGYMSPEQARGDTRHVNTRSDVFSLGVMLYEVLCGRTPFDAQSLYRLLDAIAQEDPAPPRRVRADVPRDLETICLKCLEKDPARRYADAEELARDLDRYLRAERVVARRSGLVYHLLRRAGRNRPAAYAILCLAVVLVTLVVALPLRERARARRGERLLSEGIDLARQEKWDDALRRLELAQESLGERADIVAVVRDTQRRKEERARSARDEEAESEEEIETEMEADAEAARVLDRAEQDLLLGFADLARGDRAACARKASRALSALRAGEARPDESRARRGCGLALYRLWQSEDPRGRLEEAEQEYRAAIDQDGADVQALQGLLEVRLAGLRDGWSRLEGAWSGEGTRMSVQWARVEASDGWLRDLAALAGPVLERVEESEPEADRRSEACLLWARGAALIGQGKTAEAIQPLADIDEPQDLAASARRLAGECLLYVLGRPDEAAGELESAERLGGGSVGLLVELAQARSEGGRWDEAREAWEEALEGRPDEALWRAHLGLAILALDQDGEEEDEVRAQLTRALEGGLAPGPLRAFVESQTR